MADYVGQQLGNYRLLRVLGQGAFATVYLGEHQYLERLAAIKVLHVRIESARHESFRREARTIAQLDHAHIIEVYDFGIEDQTPYLVMEHIQGGTLRECHPKGTQLAPQQIVTYVKQIASALDYAHQQRVIHRDIKPENILLNSKGEVIISDFGLAVVQHTLDSLSIQKPAGTPLYMAPEQIQHKPCAASDQYALGVMVYEWLCGEPPFHGALFEVLSQHMHKPPPSLCVRVKELPPAVEDAVMSTLAKDKRQRFVSVTDFAQVLEEAFFATQPLSPSWLVEYRPQTALPEASVLPPSEQEHSDEATQPRLSAVPHTSCEHEVVQRVPPQPATHSHTTLKQAKHSLTGTEKQASVASQDNRDVMLKKVHDIWITGVLEQSLYKELLIELGLEKHPKLVENPWRIVVQETDQPATPLPVGTSITQAYDRTEGGLLILGAPGAGKTTLLLTLARTLLERAHKQKSEPMPVIFHLSTWSQQQLPLEEWLIVELHDRYGIPRTIGTTWVKNKQLLLLLDGLDEVAPSARRKCITTINQYREQFPFVPLVVCSRHQDYLDLPIRLRLPTALLIQPLADEQIEEYLTALGEEVLGLREVLHKDDELQALARTPLLLSILALAYQGKSHEMISGNRLAGGAQEQVFASYVQRMLTRRGVDTRYPSQKTTRWLATLAKQMKQQNQTLFSLEQMQPTWLPNASSRHFYIFGGVRLLGILLGVLISLIFTCFFFIPTMRFPPAFITFSILVGGLLGSLFSRTQREGEPVASTKNSFARRILARAAVALSTGIVMGIATKSSLESLFPSNPLQQNATVGAIGLGCSLLTFFIGAGASSRTANQEAGDTSRKSVIRNLFRSPPLRSGGLVGGIAILAIVFGSGLYYALSGDRMWDTNTWLSILAVSPIIGLLFGSLGALVCFLLAATDRSGKIQVVERLTWTWQSLWQSLKNREHLKNVLLVGFFLLVAAGLYSLLLLWNGYSYYKDNPTALVTSLISVLSIVLGGVAMYWTIFGLFRGVSSRQLNERERMVPNQGIHRSAWNGLRFGFIGGAICLLVCILSIASIFVVSLVSSFMLARINNSGVDTTSSTSGMGNIDLSIFLPFLPAILVFAIASCLVIALQTGWIACLRHYLLRWLLWFNGSIPWNYAQFLDYATERLLLRKAGGGYIFMHRLLLDYLASLDMSVIEKEASTLPSRKKTPIDLPQTPIIHQQRSTGHKTGAIVLLEVMLLLALTCGVSFFGNAQQHIYNIDSAATANANNVAYTATAVAQAKANADAETAVNALPIVYPPTNTPPVLDDPLQDNSKGNNWKVENSQYGNCKFINQVYGINTNGQQWCSARATNFTNFIYEVQMKIIKGDGYGGLAFRSDPMNEYLSYSFTIDQHGVYHITDSHHTLDVGSNAVIHQGLNQTNLVAVVARGTIIELYVNHERVAVVGSSTYTHGRIGMIATTRSASQTEVIFQNAKVWKL